MRYLPVFLLLFGCIPEARRPSSLPPLVLPVREAALPVSSSSTMPLQTEEAYPSGPESKNPDVTSPEKMVQTSGVALLVGPERHSHYMQFWPKGRAAEIVRSHGDVVFYDDESMPKVYQVWDRGALSGLLRVNGGQTTANLEFPWRDPAGVPSGSNVATIRWVQLGGPIEWWRGEYQDGSFSRFRWRYPEGTRFGEILAVSDSSGHDHVFEMRTRLKREDGRWVVQAYRPFPEESDFIDALAERGLAYEPPGSTPARVDSAHQRNRFVATGWLVPTPMVQPETIAELLDETPFLPVRGLSWREGVSSPTASGFSIVPSGYLGSFIPVDNASCMRCHEDAGRVVNLQGEQRWRLRGDDGIFSFHIWDADGIRTGALRLNQKLVDAGLLVHAEGMP